MLVRYRQIAGFLPVSQLAPENYPRVNGGDKGKILEKLKSFVSKEFEVKVMTLEEREDKIIFSEKDAWNERQKDVSQKYKISTVIEGTITAAIAEIRKKMPSDTATCVIRSTWRGHSVIFC